MRRRAASRSCLRARARARRPLYPHTNASVCVRSEFVFLARARPPSRAVLALSARDAKCDCAPARRNARARAHAPGRALFRSGSRSRRSRPPRLHHRVSLPTARESDGPTRGRRPGAALGARDETHAGARRRGPRRPRVRRPDFARAPLVAEADGGAAAYGADAEFVEDGDRRGLENIDLSQVAPAASDFDGVRVFRSLDVLGPAAMGDGLAGAPWAQGGQAQLSDADPFAPFPDAAAPPRRRRARGPCRAGRGRRVGGRARRRRARAPAVCHTRRDARARARGRLRARAARRARGRGRRARRRVARRRGDAATLACSAWPGSAGAVATASSSLTCALPARTRVVVVIVGRRRARAPRRVPPHERRPVRLRRALRAARRRDPGGGHARGRARRRARRRRRAHQRRRRRGRARGRVRAARAGAPTRRARTHSARPPARSRAAARRPEQLGADGALVRARLVARLGDETAAAATPPCCAHARASRCSPPARAPRRRGGRRARRRARAAQFFAGARARVRALGTPAARAATTPTSPCPARTRARPRAPRRAARVPRVRARCASTGARARALARAWRRRRAARGALPRRARAAADRGRRRAREVAEGGDRDAASRGRRAARAPRRSRCRSRHGAHALDRARARARPVVEIGRRQQRCALLSMGAIMERRARSEARRTRVVQPPLSWACSSVAARALRKLPDVPPRRFPRRWQSLRTHAAS